MAVPALAVVKVKVGFVAPMLVRMMVLLLPLHVGFSMAAQGPIVVGLAVVPVALAAFAAGAGTSEADSSAVLVLAVPRLLWVGVGSPAWAAFLACWFVLAPRCSEAGPDVAIGAASAVLGSSVFLAREVVVSGQ